MEQTEAASWKKEQSFKHRSVTHTVKESEESNMTRSPPVFEPCSLESSTVPGTEQVQTRQLLTKGTHVCLENSNCQVPCPFPLLNKCRCLKYMMMGNKSLTLLSLNLTINAAYGCLTFAWPTQQHTSTQK